VDLNRNSVACNRGVAVIFKETIERYPLMSRKLFASILWPGNVRDLEHTREHAFVLCSQNVSAPGIEHRSPAIFEVLGNTSRNKTKAARLLGIDRVTLNRKIKRDKLTKDNT
jgi:DNA-binding NtrC family response regulator